VSQNDLSILICSCDEYADIWPQFFFFIKKHWPDCPWPLYLMTNHKNWDYPGLTVVNVGHAPWGTRFLNAVNALKTKYALIFMEDYLLLETPDESFIRQALDFMRDEEISYLRLYPVPGPDRIIKRLRDIDIGEINRGSDYRVSLQAAIWDVDYIKRLARPKDSPWDFEISGTERSNRMKDKLCSVSAETRYPISYYCTAVDKGRWKKGAVKLCRGNGIKPDLKKRKIEPFYRRRNLRSVIKLIEIKEEAKRILKEKTLFRT